MPRRPAPQRVAAKTLRLIAALAVVSCAGGAPPQVIKDPPEVIRDRLRTAGVLVDASFSEGVQYLGVEVEPARPAAGEDVWLRHYFFTERSVGADWRVFVHVLCDGAGGWIPHADHDPELPTSAWPPGKVVVDRHVLRLPDRLPCATVSLRLGLYRGERRLPVAGASLGKSDGTDRLVVGPIAVVGSPPPLPDYRAPRLAQPPRLDGVIDDAEWGGASWTTPFVRSVGDGPSALLTRARLGWDATSLYLAFSAADPDVIATLTERDAPIYREEALEIFIDAAGHGDRYVELQVSPRNVQFDAAFSGGPRRNMRRDFDARYQTAVQSGAAGSTERTTTAEWAIDVASLRPALPDLVWPPDPAAPWRLNLLRIAKDRDASGKVVTDESAWSPPMMGDFHNLERFGKVWFGAGAGP